MSTFIMKYLMMVMWQNSWNSVFSVSINDWILKYKQYNHEKLSNCEGSAHLIAIKVYYCQRNEYSVVYSMAQFCENSRYSDTSLYGTSGTPAPQTVRGQYGENLRIDFTFTLQLRLLIITLK